MSVSQLHRQLGATSPVTASPNKKLQRLVRNQLSPSLKNSHSLRLRNFNLTAQNMIQDVFNQCGSQVNRIISLDISYSIADESTLKTFCAGLPQLHTLRAVECGLSRIAEDTSWPQLLQNINLSRNQLTSVPPKLCDLLELTELNLSGNTITELNPLLLALPKLKKLHLLNNPIQNAPRSVCHEGVHKLRQFFRVAPRCLPKPERGQLDLRRLVLQHQGSTDSGYETCHRSASTSSHCSTGTFSEIESIDRGKEDWPCFKQDALPNGYKSTAISNVCQIYLPEGYDLSISIQAVKDVSLHPKVAANELLISPVVQILPHGAQFSENKPAIIVLSHCTQQSKDSLLEIIPFCSDTNQHQLPHWHKLSSSDAPKIFKDCVMFSTTHFSLFAVLSSVPYPSSSLLLSPFEGSTLKLDELKGFKIEFPHNSVASTISINTTVYYTEEPYTVVNSQFSPATVSIGVQPHGLHFNHPVRVSLPVPHFHQITQLFPNASLQLVHAPNTETKNGELKWKFAEIQDYEITTENGLTIVSFETAHFSLFDFLWNVSQETLQKFGLGASYVYRQLTSRARYLSVRWQAFMSRPLRNLSFGLVVCIYKFGEPLWELSNYPWQVADSGPKGVFLQVGELKVTLHGHFNANNEVGEILDRTTTVVDFKGHDFSVRFDFALKLSNELTTPLEDGQFLGKLIFSQENENRPVITSYNLIKPPENTFPGPFINTTGYQPNMESLTPPWTPEDATEMDCEEVFTSLSLSTDYGVQLGCSNRKHRRQNSITEGYNVQSKRRLFVRIDNINDKTLLGISQAACSKYIDLGVQLGLPYNVIDSVTGGVGSSRPEHLKAFYILQEWKGRAGGDFTFEALSKALEDVGLQSVAQEHCYTNHST